VRPPEVWENWENWNPCTRDRAPAFVLSIERFSIYHLPVFHFQFTISTYLHKCVCAVSQHLFYTLTLPFFPWAPYSQLICDHHSTISDLRWISTPQHSRLCNQAAIKGVRPNKWKCQSISLQRRKKDLLKIFLTFNNLCINLENLILPHRT